MHDFLWLLLSRIAEWNLPFCEHVHVALRLSSVLRAFVCFSWICRPFTASPSSSV